MIGGFMIPLVVRGVSIGAGIPKICVSLTSKSKVELMDDAEALCKINALNEDNFIDLVEWRADYYEAIGDSDEHLQLLEALSEIRRIIGEKPLIFTYRSAHEGGAHSEASGSDLYLKRLKTAIQSGLIDLVDIELFMGEAITSELVDYAHAHDVKVIASNHDFMGTPKLEDLVDRLRGMQKMDADILKIAVMPADKKDVLTLLEATVIMSEQYADRPIVTISMSEQGAITRVIGGVFGSSIAYCHVGKTSAPGQINAYEIKEMLLRLHRILKIENKL